MLSISHVTRPFATCEAVRVTWRVTSAAVGKSDGVLRGASS